MGGATPIRWIAEAEDLRPSGTSGTMSGKGGPRATLHCTVSSPTQFNDMHRVLIGKQAEPHLLYSFAEDRLGQYFPLDRSARALMGSTRTPSGISHNRVGTVNIQIEVVGTTDDWTARPDWRPGPKFRAMMAAIASWGIRPEFIYRPATSSTDRANVVRSFATMTGDAGGWKWWGHCHYPDGESHWDPGRVNVSRFFAAAYGGTVTPTPAPPEDDMTPAELAAALDPITGNQTLRKNLGSAVLGYKNLSVDPDDAFKNIVDAANAKSATIDTDALAAAIVAKLPANVDGLSIDEVRAGAEAAIRNVLGSVDDNPSAT